MDFVTDTHPLLWNLFKPRLLGSAAFAAFQAVDQGQARLLVPALVISEMLMVAEKGRIPNVGLQKVLDEIELMRLSPYHVLLPLLPETVVASHKLNSIPDIFDRLIVAEARRLNLPLLTRDGVITNSGLVNVIWD